MVIDRFVKNVTWPVGS